jgi:hypothetical protein
MPEEKTVKLTCTIYTSQSKWLQDQASKRRRETGDNVGVSEIVREALDAFIEKEGEK